MRHQNQERNSWSGLMNKPNGQKVIPMKITMFQLKNFSHFIWK